MIVISITIVLGVPALRYAGPAMDEGLLLLYPELVLRGLVPNRDFLASYGPGGFWLLGGVFAVLGSHVEIERVIGLAYHVALALVLFAHAQRWGPAIGVLSGIVGAVALIPLGAAAYVWIAAAALAAWTVFLLSSRTSIRATFAAGALAGGAALFRPELVVSETLALLPFFVASSGSRRRALVGGAAVGLAPLVVHALVAGLPAVLDNLVLAVFKWGPGRVLPLPGTEPLLLSLVLAADAAAVSAGVYALRAERSDRARALLALGVLSSATASHAFQRADLFHLASAGAIPLALLPVSIVALVGPARERVGRIGAIIAVPLLLAICAPHLVARAALVETPRALGPLRQDIFIVEHGERSWYPLAPSVDFQYSPAGSASSAAELRETLDEVDRIAATGARLFVGPRDLRRTNNTDTVVYHLLPQLRPATYYLEMAPGTTNAPESHLAQDIAGADILVLTDRYDGWNEPNASMRFGPDAPNDVVRERFEVRARHGSYWVYTRRAASAASAADAVPAR